MSILYRVTLLLLPEILVSASWSPTDSVAHDLRHPLEQDGKEGTTIRVPVRRQRPSSRRARSLLQLDRKESNLPTASRIFGTLFVGTPPQKLDVAFDTGSGNLLLPAKACKSLACFAHKTFDESLSMTVQNMTEFKPRMGLGLTNHERVRLGVGSGEVAGSAIVDKVCLDEAENVCSNSGIVELMEMSDEPFNIYPFDGILGLGLPASSIDPRFNLLGNMADGHVLANARFAVWMAVETDSDESEFSFGSYDEKRLNSEIFWIPLSNTANGLWQVTVKDLYLNNRRLHLCGDVGCQVAFDTGTAAIGGPTPIMRTLLSQLGVSSTCTNFGSLGKLGFDFGDYILYVDKDDYVRTEAGTCHHQFVGIDLPPPRHNIIFLGDPFFRRYYTIFDRTTLSVGLGHAVHTPEPAAGSRLSREKMMVFRGVRD